MPIVGGPAVAGVIDGDVVRLRALADFNPADGTAMRRYIDALGVQSDLRRTPFPRDEIIARFAVAPCDGDTWARYGDLMASGMDWHKLDRAKVAAVRRNYQNGVFYTNHSTGNLRALDGFNRTTWAWLEQQRRNPAADTADTDDTALAGDPFDAMVVCPTIRAIRVHAAVCQDRPGQVACPRPDDPSDPAYGLIAQAEKRRACAAALQAPVRMLAYQPVPVDLPQAR